MKPLTRARSCDDIDLLLRGQKAADGKQKDVDGSSKGNLKSSSSGVGKGGTKARKDHTTDGERDSFPTTYPPPNYVQLDNNLHRTHLPILEHNLLFLDHLELDVIMNLSGYPLEPALLSFCEQSGIAIYELHDLMSSSTDDADDANVDIDDADENIVNSSRGSRGSRSSSDGGVDASKSGNADRGCQKNAGGNVSGKNEVTIKTITADIAACKDWLIKTLNVLLSFNEANILLIGESSSILDVILISSLRKLQTWVFTSIIFEFRFLTGKKMFDYEQFIESVDLSEVKIPNPAPR